jgi:hypothetical protein
MEKKKIIVCGGGTAQREELMRKVANIDKYTVLTIEEAKEQGINMSEVVVIDEGVLKPPAITITEIIPMLEGMKYTHYTDDVKRSKGHERPYRFHR